MAKDVEHIFKSLLAICNFSFEKSVYFYILLKNRTFTWCYIYIYFSSLYVLETDLLSEGWLTQTCSHSAGCLFTQWIVSFVLQKLCLKKTQESSCNLLIAIPYKTKIKKLTYL